MAFPAAAVSQQLVCRDARKAGAVFTLERVEAWPALSPAFFTGPDVRAALLTDGSAVVIDRARNELIRIDRETGNVTSLARNGSGPGEIKAVLGLVADGGTIAVLDAGNGRVTMFDDRGHLRQSQPYRFVGIPLFFAYVGRNLVEVTRDRGQRGQAAATAMNIHTLGAGSTVTIRDVTLPDPPAVAGLFTPTGVAAVMNPGQLLLASGASRDVMVISLNGAGDHAARLGLGPALRTTHEMAARLTAQASTQIPAANRKAVVNAMLASVPLSPIYPMFSRLLVGAAGSLWVQRTFTGEAAATVSEPPSTFSMNDLGGYVWQQFAPDGALAAECAMPKEWRVLGAGSGWVLFAKDDGTNTQLYTWRPK
jgi:hypothetical protein